MSVINTLNTLPSLEQEEMKKQGIVAILGEERTKNAASIRRTLSADMSSKSWLKENGFFSSVKRNPYSYGFDSSSSSSSSESEEEWERKPSAEDVWKDIVKKEKPEKTEKCGSMILITQKSEGSVLPVPYVHPLVKRSARYMSEKSLQMCTEPLGSETGAVAGADCCLSSYSCSQGGGYRETVAGRKQSSNKKSPAPPPLSSVSGKDGSALCIQSRRENGRLVIEAVPQEPRNHFITERRDGRLVLSLARASPAPAVVEEDGDDDAFVEEKKRSTFVVSENLNTLLPSGLHKLVMKRLSTNGNKNPTETDKNTLSSITQSPPPVATLLIPQPPSFNAYEYFWRSKTSGAGAPTTLKRSKNNSQTMKSNENQKLDEVVTKGNREDYLVSYLKGCKETRKRILFWEVDCILTS